MTRYVTTVVLGWCVWMLAGCSPALNWRDVRFESGTLVALFPCQPDRGTRMVPLGEASVSMTMLGCEAEGAMLTLARVSAGDPAQAAALMHPWRQATLESAGAALAQEEAFTLRHARPMPAPVRLHAQGQGRDGAPLALHVVWFALDDAVYQAAVYEPPSAPSVAPAFFEGLRVNPGVASNR